ncbi:MAG: hypothetical protein GY906_13260, partial [bacterium]|nr:hypothetical protein [bacterium]
MKRVLMFSAIAVLIGAIPVAAQQPLLLASHGQEVGRLKQPAPTVNLMANLTAMYTQAELEAGVYLGDEHCIACHSWSGITRDVKHRQALRKPMASLSLIAGRGVVADFDNNGVDDFMQGLNFNDISSVFDPFKPNAPILGYDGMNYTIQIGELTMPVAITQGGTGDWKQRYLLQVPVSGTQSGLTNGNYVSPVQYNEKTHGYVLYHPEAWYDDVNMPRYGSTTT